MNEGGMSRSVAGAVMEMLLLLLLKVMPLIQLLSLRRLAGYCFFNTTATTECYC